MATNTVPRKKDTSALMPQFCEPPAAAPTRREASQADKQALLGYALLKMRDVVDDYADLPPEVRGPLITAVANFIGDLRALGVVR